MILHLVKHSPFSHTDLISCLDIMEEQDGLLLMEDGVLVASVSEHPLYDRLQSLKYLYIIKPDCDARGVQNKLGKLIDYSDMVELCLSFNKTMSW